LDPTPIMALTSDALRAEAKARIPRGHGVAAQIYRQALTAGEFVPERFGLGETAAAAWRSAFRLERLEVRQVVAEPAFDGRLTEKAILGTADGLEVECVRIPMGRDRFTLCVSSQVGCRLACAFCETGKIGLVRSLRCEEIVGQVVTVRAELGWDASHIVFMGMGEPLDNADALIDALRVLADPRGLAYGQPRLTVCTAGHVEGLAKLAALGWSRLDLSVSLNAATDDKRDRLMPINRRVPLAELQAALVRYREGSRVVFAINYCLLPGFNDTRDDARAVADFCAPLGRHVVHVIPYNPGSKPLTRAPEPEEVDRFAGWLKDEGLPVQRRRTKGRGVMAACGQLGNLDLRTRRQRGLPVYGERS
jgi:23S rRNA (adenine2503-C2)-methyltransferase